jgi:beta-galactosidase
MDTCGFPKDNFYYYQAWWSDKTVLHILPHWNWPGKEGQEINVWVLSNCEEVELFLKGKSLGRQKMPLNSHLEWKVKYTPGVLRARGYKNGKQIAEAREETTGAPAAVKLIPDRTIINADGEDVSLVTVAIVDAKGRIVPVANNEVHFTLDGPGQIIGVGNGHPNTTESDKLPQRSVFNGLAQVIIQSEKHSGKMKLIAESTGLQAATATIKSTTCTLRNRRWIAFANECCLRSRQPTRFALFRIVRWPALHSHWVKYDCTSGRRRIIRHGNVDEKS